MPGRWIRFGLSFKLMMRWEFVFKPHYPWAKATRLWRFQQDFCVIINSQLPRSFSSGLLRIYNNCPLFKINFLAF
jgi:hypothetical protein